MNIKALPLLKPTEARATVTDKQLTQTPAREGAKTSPRDADGLTPVVAGFKDGTRADPEAHKQFGKAAFEIGQATADSGPQKKTETRFTRGLQHLDDGELDRSTPLLRGVAVLNDLDFGFAWWRREAGVDYIAVDRPSDRASEAQLETIVRERTGDPSLRVRVYPKGIPQVDAKRIDEATALVKSLAAGQPVTDLRVQDGRGVYLTMGVQFSPDTTPEVQASTLKDIQTKLDDQGYQDVRLEPWGPVFSDKPEHATEAAARLNEAIEKRSFTGWPALLNAPRFTPSFMNWSYQFVPVGGKIELRSQLENPRMEMILVHMNDAFRQLGLPHMIDVEQRAL